MELIMKNKYAKWVTCGFLGLMAVLCLDSCTDDHYDLNSNNAKGTLWENLSATGECNDFLNILSKAVVNKKAYGVPASITYADLLKADNSMTAWAPKDGTYDAQKWLDLLAEAKQADESGDLTTAADKYKVVEKQFVKNHLSYFNYNGSYGTSSRIALANGKYATYNSAMGTIKDIAIESGASGTIPCVNGTAHVLTSYIPYSYDLKEILEATPDLSLMNDYVASKDTLIFLESQSIKGATVDGQVQYVDSVFSESNKLMPDIASNADSLVAAIYFKNDAWQKALEYTKKSYCYKTAYSYIDEKGDVYTDSLRADSLQEAKAVSALFKNMFYSLNEQPAFPKSLANAETVKSFFETTDSLASVDYYGTYDQYQRAPYANTLTDGQTPVEVSNGYVFMVDNFNFKANKSWQFDKTIEAEGGNQVNTQYSKSLSTASPRGVSYTVLESACNPAVSGKLSDDSYQEFVPSSSAANPQVTFDLKSVLSGTYDIYAVIVPENISDTTNVSPKANKFTATLTYDFDDQGKQLTVASTLGDNGTFTNDVTKIDTIKLFDNYKFDVCYYEISKCNPMLTITSSIKLKDRKSCTPNLRIDCILLVGKDE
jgi:hypothetical protein